MPSPRGSNNARMFLFHCPKGQDPKGALDAALRKSARDNADPERERCDAELRDAMERLIQNYVHEDLMSAALEELDTHLPAAKYGDHHEAEEVEDEDREELYGEREMPRNAREGGMGARVAELEGRDRRHGARDKRRQAMDAAESSFDRMFPGASRIKTAV